MTKLPLPWETYTFIEYPWGLYLTIVLLAIPLSFLSFILEKKRKK